MQVSAIVKEKAQQQEQYYHEKYYSIFEAAIEYLKKQDVYMYGGTALDQYMPAKYKIYDKYQLPDIDVFSTNPVRLSNGLVAILSKSGLKSSKQEAFHNGTISVFCEGLKVADVSHMSQEYLRRFSSSSGLRGDMGIKLISMDFIRFTLHAMLATSSSQRWEKVVKRLESVYTVFPLMKPDWAKHTVRVTDYARDVMAVNEAIHVLTEGSKDQNTILLGTPIVAMMVGKVINAIHNVPYNILIVSGSVSAYANTIVKSFPEAHLTVEKCDDAPDYLFQPPHVAIRYGNVIVALIFQASSKCFSYNDVQGRNVGTIHTMLMFYFSMYLSIDPHFVRMRPSLLCIINALSAVCKQTISNKPSKTLLNHLSLKCMGYEEGLATLRRNHFKPANKPTHKHRPRPHLV